MTDENKHHLVNGWIKVANWPKPQSHLIIVDGFYIEFNHPMPCAFWRFWQWVLLGWRWEKINK